MREQQGAYAEKRHHRVRDMVPGGRHPQTRDQHEDRQHDAFVARHRPHARERIPRELGRVRREPDLGRIDPVDQIDDEQQRIDAWHDVDVSRVGGLAPPVASVNLA